MTTFREIISKFDSFNQDWAGQELLDVDVGNYDFDDIQRTGEFFYEFKDKENKNIILAFNEDRQALNLYELQDDDKVKATVWMRGDKYTKSFNKDEISVSFD